MGHSQHPELVTGRHTGMTEPEKSPHPVKGRKEEV